MRVPPLTIRLAIGIVCSAAVIRPSVVAILASIGTAETFGSITTMAMIASRTATFAIRAECRRRQARAGSPRTGSNP